MRGPRRFCVEAVAVAIEDNFKTFKCHLTTQDGFIIFRIVKIVYKPRKHVENAVNHIIHQLPSASIAAVQPVSAPINMGKSGQVKILGVGASEPGNSTSNGGWFGLYSPSLLWSEGEDPLREQDKLDFNFKFIF